MLIVNAKCKTAHFSVLTRKNNNVFAFIYIVSKIAKGNTNNSKYFKFFYN